jgi:hypothetical protein
MGSRESDFDFIAKDGFIWSVLLHFGTHGWGECLDGYGRLKKDYSNKMNFDEKVWKSLTNRLPKSGANMVVVDVFDSVKYRKHPEISVEDAWSPERLNAEVRRLKALGLEPIPKLNFSSTHDQWLKVYHRMVGTPEYYDVCASAIAEVAEIFERPRFFHIGMDEEDFDQTNGFSDGLRVFRRGDIWWHDVRFFADCCEKAGCRPWMWADYAKYWPEEFVKNCPKSMVLSAWYYKWGCDEFRDMPTNAAEWWWKVQLKVMRMLDKEGFDQIPCASNHYAPGSFAALSEWCDDCLLDKSHLLGLMMASWRFTLPGDCERRNNEAIVEVETTIKTKRLRKARRAGIKVAKPKG